MRGPEYVRVCSWSLHDRFAMADGSICYYFQDQAPRLLALAVAALPKCLKAALFLARSILVWQMKIKKPRVRHLSQRHERFPLHQICKRIHLQYGPRDRLNDDWWEVSLLIYGLYNRVSSKDPYFIWYGRCPRVPKRGCTYHNNHSVYGPGW